MDASQSVNDLIAVTGRLVEVMKREIQILKTMDLEELKALQGDKQGLADVYEKRVRALSGDPEAFGAVEPVLRDELRATTEEFHTVAGRNQRALAAARQVNRKVIEAVVDAIQDKAAETNVYQSSGALSGIGNAQGAEHVSIAVDQRS